MTKKNIMKNAWTKLNSPKSKATYRKTINAMSKLGAGTANYFERTNRSLDRVVGTRDPNPGRMTGVALPKGYKIQTVPKIIKGPRGYSVFEEKQLVKIGSKGKTKSRKKKRR